MIQSIKSKGAAALLFIMTALPLSAETVSGSDGPVFKVMLVIMVVWVGIAAYLFSLDRKIRRVEKDLDEL